MYATTEGPSAWLESHHGLGALQVHAMDMPTFYRCYRCDGQSQRDVSYAMSESLLQWVHRWSTSTCPPCDSVTIVAGGRCLSHVAHFPTRASWVEISTREWAYLCQACHRLMYGTQGNNSLWDPSRLTPRRFLKLWATLRCTVIQQRHWLHLVSGTDIMIERLFYRIKAAITLVATVVCFSMGSTLG